MSVIAVKVDERSIHIASDSQVSYGSTKRITGETPKIQKTNGMIIGASGNCEETSLFLHFCSTHKPDGASEKALSDMLVEFSRWKKDRTGEHKIENNYIIVLDSKVFTVNGFYIKGVEDFDAIGSGRDFALAAMSLGFSPYCGVDTACKFNAWCGGEIIHYEEVKS